MNKVDPDFKDSNGRTPLSWAAENGHELVMCLLLVMDKVDPDAGDNLGWTPLSWAAWKGKDEVMWLLLGMTGSIQINCQNLNERHCRWQQRKATRL
jgi:ankyrin repeat protein